MRNRKHSSSDAVVESFCEKIEEGIPWCYLEGKGKLVCSANCLVSLKSKSMFLVLSQGIREPESHYTESPHSLAH